VWVNFQLKRETPENTEVGFGAVLLRAIPSLIVGVESGPMYPTRSLSKESWVYVSAPGVSDMLGFLHGGLLYRKSYIVD
jgi:hypothetical protein